MQPPPASNDSSYPPGPTVPQSYPTTANIQPPTRTTATQAKRKGQPAQKPVSKATGQNANSAPTRAAESHPRPRQTGSKITDPQQRTTTTMLPLPLQTTQPTATSRDNKQQAPNVSAPALPTAARSGPVNTGQQPGTLQARWESIVNEPPSSTPWEKKSAQAEIIKQKTSIPTQKATEIPFSVALSKDGLGHFGGVQFWDSVEEFIHHSRTVSELHEKAKYYAKWVVYHDKKFEKIDKRGADAEVDNLLSTLFKIENASPDDGRGARTAPPGRSVLHPDLITCQLQADIKFCLKENHPDLHGLDFTTPASVKKLRGLATSRQINSYRRKVQVLALTVSRVLEAQQDGLFDFATDRTTLDRAKVFVENTDKAIEAYYRGTATLRERFFFNDELRNSISAHLRAVVKEEYGDEMTDEKWLAAYINAATALRTIMERSNFVPRVNCLAPELLERAASNLDDIVYHAQSEMRKIVKRKPKQPPALGKHARTDGDDSNGNEVKDDDQVLPPPKKPKTKDAAKEQLVSTTQTKPSTFKQHAPFEGKAWSALDQDGELYIAQGNGKPNAGSQKPDPNSAHRPPFPQDNGNNNPTNTQDIAATASAQPAQPVSAAPQNPLAQAKSRVAYTREDRTSSSVSQGQGTKRRHAFVVDEQEQVEQPSHSKKQRLSPNDEGRLQYDKSPGINGAEDGLQGQLDNGLPPPPPHASKKGNDNGKLGLESYLSEKGSSAKSQALVKEDWVQKALNKQRRRAN